MTKRGLSIIAILVILAAAIFVIVNDRSDIARLRQSLASLQAQQQSPVEVTSENTHVSNLLAEATPQTEPAGSSVKPPPVPREVAPPHEENQNFEQGHPQANQQRSSQPPLSSTTFLASVPASAGDITGTVVLKGRPPPEKEIFPIKDDLNCGKLHTGSTKTRFYVVGANNGLADAFVVLRGVSNKASNPSSEPVVLDQKGCEYQPYVFGAQAGQEIIVKNSDPVVHSVHPTPAATGNKEENKAQMAYGPDLIMMFPSPEMFLRFKCDAHPWMFAYACVVEHPYFAVTDGDGKYTIKKVPEGNYTIEVYHRKAAPTTAPVIDTVEVKGASVSKDFVLEAK